MRSREQACFGQTLPCKASMKIVPSQRVEYKNNPLAEVVCQVRFERINEFASSLPKTIESDLIAQGYSVTTTEETLHLSVPLAHTDGSQPFAQKTSLKIFQFEEPNREWKVSVCSEFIAVTCLRYTRWNDFLPRMLRCVSMFNASIPAAKLIRIGLRYKNVIEREAIGLAGTPWQELIDGSLLGPLGCSRLFDDDRVDESSIPVFFSQTSMQLDDCGVLLQSALLHSQNGDRKAFLIDADFYIDSDIDQDRMRSPDKLGSDLDRLHSSTGALFRRVITEKLHHALGPDL